MLKIQEEEVKEELFVALNLVQDDREKKSHVQGE